MKGFRKVLFLCLVISGSMFAAAGQTASAASDYFGANLAGGPQNSNAYQGKPCSDIVGGPESTGCTWVVARAYHNGVNSAGAKAPHDGTIHKIRLIAGVAGSFRLMIARYKPGTTEAKIVKKGPIIHYVELPNQGEPTYKAQTFNVAIAVKQGDFLAFQTNKASFLRCDSGSPNTAVYNPPLAVGGPFTPADDVDGCFALIQARY